MFARFILFAAFCLPAGIALAVESYTVDPNHTFPTFEINHLGFSTQRGRFNSTKGKITFDPQAQQASADIAIDAASISTGLAKLEARLRQPEFFDVEKYPTITFKSTTAHFSGESLTGLDGELTMRGQTKPVTLQVNNLKCGIHPLNRKALCSADVAGTIKRSDFGIKYGLPLLGDDVKLLIPVEAYKDT
jgi:polyisoprenoid-binding protein YceI